MPGGGIELIHRLIEEATAIPQYVALTKIKVCFM
jgi:hypothetical protein